MGLCYFASSCDEDDLLEASLELSIEDFYRNQDETYTVVTEWEKLTTIKESLVSQGFQLLDFEIVRKAEIEIDIEKKHLENLLSLMEILDDLDDVQNVFTNANISEDMLEELDSNI